MKITKKLVKIGNSYGFIIDKILASRLNIQHGDEIEVEIKKIIEYETYKCHYCDYVFASGDEDIYCPNCEKTDCLEILKSGFEEFHPNNKQNSSGNGQESAR